MARKLAHQRCYNHGKREAVARCPECGRYFCRECITEHESRVVCASCLADLTGQKKKRSSSFTMAARLFQLLFGLLLVWLFFYTLGQGLLALPTSFHEGTVWEASHTEP